ncbi:hypothetical protein ITJ64_17680 [Herbiconiux sp. VKM Ac-1786]|uniref:hypothetical protein n=1 Tax=Herbiconiux sp. VKM Ac-1786 TaxID=2783824 RepID=UPI00188CF66A|nr:hypothetical protein [Herbiconiux sp. VKM Ac-1786]MBF4574345.1 hypothetical protein [Herbiconiux sp. VKM Ac-1786]
MQPVLSGDPGAWIAPRLGGWGSVGGVAGRGFEAYARVLHPVEVDDGAGGALGPWGWAEVAARTGRVVHPLAQWHRVAGVDELRGDVEVDGRRVSAPPTGRLDPRLLAALVPALAAATTSDAVTLAVWEGWGHGVTLPGPRFELPGRAYGLLGGRLAELADPEWPWAAGIGWTPPFEGPMPQLIWPADHAWVLASEIDWDSTIVAGSRALIDAVLALDVVEAFPVDADDSLMSHADLINPA